MRASMLVAGSIVAALAVLGNVAAAADFPSVVTQILMSKTSGAMSRMSDSREALDDRLRHQMAPGRAESEKAICGGGRKSR